MEQQQLDVNKVIEVLSARHSHTVAALEREIAVLVVQREHLAEENKQLKEGKTNAKK
ncbi:hypothetical protein [Halobacillus naozhouensis]|uniref:Uncharacterized protein n=1 Tax=Halobacillus naozhouensis TaxID=554880 RepID=A0ABY8J2G5_9BACI|nr:hypothetical protein [Halobacillus naozhouensis]WFT76252.1 hypothetical protein P9989_07780 [Halobacillus naozhouensis]